jgi:hypothetical protein
MSAHGLITGIAVLFLATGTAHASYIDIKHNRCYTNDGVRVPCSDMIDGIVCKRRSCKEIKK